MTYRRHTSTALDSGPIWRNLGIIYGIFYSKNRNFLLISWIIEGMSLARISKLPSLEVAVPVSFCCLSWVARLGLGGGTAPVTDSWCMLRLLDLRSGLCGCDCAGAGLLTARWLILRLTDDCWGRERGLRVWGRAVSATAGSSVGLLRGRANWSKRDIE